MVFYVLLQDINMDKKLAADPKDPERAQEFETIEGARARAAELLKLDEEGPEEYAGALKAWIVSEVESVHGR